MLLPLLYYLSAFLVYIFLYEYYRHVLRKRVVQSDFLKNLVDLPRQVFPVRRQKTLNQISKELNACFYFNRFRIIFGIDLSASNEWHGYQTFNGQSLHRTQANRVFNPYQRAISEIGPVFEKIFPSKVTYSCFGFGDECTKDFAFFPIVGSGEEFNSYQRILDAYLEQTKNVVLSGPTSFVPMIRKLISYGIHCEHDFTMLIILTDEPNFSHQDPAIVESILTLARFPNACLLIIGLGDGPWHRMSYEEHRLRELVWSKTPKSKSLVQSKFIYDNFHFVDSSSVMAQTDKYLTDHRLARAVLTKLPTQLKQAFKHDQNNAHF